MRIIHSSPISLSAAIAIAICILGCGGESNLGSNIDTQTLFDLDGRPHALLSDSHKTITVIVFTRTDCPISNRAAPEIRQLYETFHPQGVNFYLIYVDPRQQPVSIRDHLKEYEYPCPALHDPEHTLVAATGATVTPEAVVFDANHQIVYRGRINDRNTEIGQMRSVATKHDLAEAIEATLAGRPVAEPVTKAVGCRIADLKK
jgi:hypothetical protein